MCETVSSSNKFFWNLKNRNWKHIKSLKHTWMQFTPYTFLHSKSALCRMKSRKETELWKSDALERIRSSSRTYTTRETEGTQTENACIRKTFKEGESRLAFREKHDTTLEAAALRPLAIYGNGSVNGAWSRSCFTISFSRGKGRSRYVFFSFIKDR